jgi:hypothetical protein
MPGCYASSAPRHYHDHGRRFRLVSTAERLSEQFAEAISGHSALLLEKLRRGCSRPRPRSAFS